MTSAVTLVIYGGLALVVPTLALIANKMTIFPALLAVVILLLVAGLKRWRGQAGAVVEGGVAVPPAPFLKGVMGLPVPFGVLAVLLTWMVLSWTWSVEPDRPLQTLTSLIILAAGAALLWHGAGKLPLTLWGRAVLALLPIGALAGIGFLFGNLFGANRLMEMLKGEPVLPLYFNGGMAVLAIALWPGLRVLAGTTLLQGWWRVVCPAALLALGLWSALTSESSAAALGLILGLLGAGSVFFFGVRIIRVWAVVVPLGVMALPFALPPVLERPDVFQAMKSIPISHQHRAYIWSYTADRIAEKPVLGWGIDASRALGNEEERIVFYEQSPDRPIELGVSAIPLHPHNASFQVALELGLVGLLLFAGVIFSVFWSMATCFAAAPRWQSALAVGFVLTGLGIYFTAFGAWQSWWIACWAMVAALYRLSCTSAPNNHAI